MCSLWHKLRNNLARVYVCDESKTRKSSLIYLSEWACIQFAIGHYEHFYGFYAPSSLADNNFSHWCAQTACTVRMYVLFTWRFNFGAEPSWARPQAKNSYRKPIEVLPRHWKLKRTALYIPSRRNSSSSGPNRFLHSCDVSNLFRFSSVTCSKKRQVDWEKEIDLIKVKNMISVITIIISALGILSSLVTNYIFAWNMSIIWFFYKI